MNKNIVSARHKVLQNTIIDALVWNIYVVNGMKNNIMNMVN